MRRRSLAAGWGSLRLGAEVMSTPTDGSGDFLTRRGLATGTYYAVASASGFDAELHAGLACTGCDPTTRTPIVVSAPGTASGIDFALGSKSLQFFTLSPCRVLDTRNPVGALGGPALAAQSDRIFLALASCGVPKTARALSVNVAVTAATAPGNLRLHAGRSGVPLVSAINYSAGRTRSNSAIVLLNGIGELAVFCGQSAGTTAHFILDVNGYFE